MSSFNFTDKLNKFLEKIEDETSREIKFHESTNLGIKGITAAYQYHPRYLMIIINSEYPRDSEDIERSIAHEATHGYILYRLGFCRSQYDKGVSDDYKRDVQLIFTMIEDLVVNKIIMDNGFPPFGHEYLPMVLEETEIAHRGEEAGEVFYHKFTDSPHLEAILMISRYIIAWGFLRYYNLKQQEIGIIREFTKAFKNFYPDYYQYAAKIVEVLEEKNIFNGEEECEAVKEILELFNMDESVKLVRN